MISRDFSLKVEEEPPDYPIVEEDYPRDDDVPPRGRETMHRPQPPVPKRWRPNKPLRHQAVDVDSARHSGRTPRPAGAAVLSGDASRHQAAEIDSARLGGRIQRPASAAVVQGDPSRAQLSRSGKLSSSADGALQATADARHASRDPSVLSPSERAPSGHDRIPRGDGKQHGEVLYVFNASEIENHSEELHWGAGSFRQDVSRGLPRTDVVTVIDRKGSQSRDAAHGIPSQDVGSETGGPAQSHEDLADLEYFDNDILVSELEKRFANGQPYTYIGDSLVAVNPCKKLKIYTDEYHKKYRDLRVRSAQGAHVFWVAAYVYHNLLLTGRSQCVVVGGDAGAGKTESTKYILQHLVRSADTTRASPRDRQHRLDQPLDCGLLAKLEKVNPLLEQFGNASTVLNNNSSRFGKLVELGYDSHGVLITAHLECFILEKFRVTSRHPREKNFHVFYALFAGLPTPLRAELWLDLAPESFRILAPYSSADGVFATVKEEKAFKKRGEKLASGLEEVGFTQKEISDLLKVLGGILQLSNIEFEDSFDSAELSDLGQEYLSKALGVLGMNCSEETLTAQTFERSLLGMTIEVRGERVWRPKTPRQARDGRDALAREMYATLFYGLIDRVNHHLRCGLPTEAPDTKASIRLLDISGFENVGVNNSFEQFIINSTNERLHQFYLQHTFTAERDEYLKEGIQMGEVNFADNTDIVDLIFAKPVGLIPLLEDAISTNNDDDGWITQCQKNHRQSIRFQSNTHSLFRISHYAGKVDYSAEGFVTKNSDTLSHDLREVVQQSDNIFIKDYFSIGSDAAAILHTCGRATVRQQNWTAKRQKLPVERLDNATSSKRTGRLTGRFTDQYLKSLSSMMGKLQTATPVFVRCIKPNSRLQPDVFDRDLVRQQLLSNGLLDVARVRRDGYPIRIKFHHFVKRYKDILDIDSPSQKPSDICDAILSKAGVEDHQKGHKKVFLKMRHRDLLEEALNIRTERKRLERERFERAEANRSAEDQIHGASSTEQGGGHHVDVETSSTASASRRIPSCNSSDTSGFASGCGTTSASQRGGQNPPQTSPGDQNVPPKDEEQEEKETKEKEKKKKEKQKREGIGNQPSYNIFRVTERDFEHSTELEMKIRRCVRFLLFLFFFLLILVCCVLSRTALTWLSDPAMKEQDLTSLKSLWMHSNRKTPLVDFRTGLVSTRLLLCLLLPLLCSWLACFFKVLFGRRDWPSLRAVILVTLLDCVGVVGRCLFVFKLLQQADAQVAVVMATAVSQVPGLLKLLSVFRFDHSSWTSSAQDGSWSLGRRKFTKVVYAVSLLLSVLVQLGTAPLLFYCATIASTLFGVEDVLGLRVPQLWTLVVALFCSSVVWWENYAYGKNYHHKAPRDEGKTAASCWLRFTSLCRLPPAFGLSSLRVDYGRIRQTSFVYTGPVQMIALIGLFLGLTKDETGVTVDLLEQLGVFFRSLASGLGNVNDFNSHMSAYNLVYIQLAGTFLGSYLSGVACRLHMQPFSFALPLLLAPPATMVLAALAHPSDLPRWYSSDSSFRRGAGDLRLQGLLWALGLLLVVANLVINVHVWFPEVERTAQQDRLFAFPYRDPVFPDVCLQCSRRQDKLENLDRTRRQKKSDEILKEGAGRPTVYICATMWHEMRQEMLQLLKSLFRVDFDAYTRKQAVNKFKAAEEYSDLYDPEIHIIFDDAFETDSKSKQKVLNSWVKQFIEVLPDALASVAKRNIDLKPPIKTPTPYGGRLLFTLPGNTRMYVHLKDKDRIRHRKRWSQILYLYYLLGFRLMADYETIDEVLQAGGSVRQRKGGHKVRRNTSLLNIIPPDKIRQADNIFIMTLDGDVDFRPDSVHLLLDRMKKNKQVAAVCGRIHPIGDGPMVWYQQFEYAVGHWLQKAAEHVFGCVLCCPGCFSLFRASALMDDNVMRMYTTEPTEASHFIQYEQGEDRWLCTLLLQQGWKIEYCAGADALTFAPETFHEFYIQRRRWSPSTMANIVDLISSWRITVKMNDNISVPFMLYEFVMMVSSILAPGLVVYMIAGSYNAVLGLDLWQSYFLSIGPVFAYIMLCLKAKTDTQINVAAVLSAVYAIVMLLVTVGTIINVATSDPYSPDVLFLVCVVAIFLVAGLVHPNEFFCLFHGLLYYITVPSTFVFLTVFFLCNMHIVTWGTRESPKSAQPAQNAGAGSGQGTVQEKGKLQKLFDKLGLAAIAQDIRAFVQGMMGLKQEVLQQQQQQPQQQQQQQQQNQQQLQAVRVVVPKPEEETVEPDPTYWTRELDVSGSTVGAIEDKETKFWSWLIEEYLLPLKANKKQQEKIKDDLISARNNVVFAYMLLNLMFTLVLLQFKLKMDMLKNAFYIAGKFEPVSTIFLGLVSLLLIVQFLGMLGHRWGTFLHLISSTSLTWFRNNEEKERALAAIQEAQKITSAEADLDIDLLNPDYSDEDDGEEAESAVATAHHSLQTPAQRDLFPLVEVAGEMQPDYSDEEEEADFGGGGVGDEGGASLRATAPPQYDAVFNKRFQTVRRKLQRRASLYQQNNHGLYPDQQQQPQPAHRLPARYQRAGPRQLERRQSLYYEPPQTRRNSIFHV